MASNDASAASPNAAGTPRLYLQVGAFVSRGNAEQLHSRLAENLIRNATVQEASRPEGPIYRVRIGPLSGAEQAYALTLRITSLRLGTPQVVID